MATKAYLNIGNISQTLSICLTLIIFASLSLTSISSGIQATGIVLDAEAAPGEEISHDILINIDKNESPADFQVDVVDMVQGPDGSNNAVNDTNEHIYSAKNFLRASPEKFHLEPGELQKIVVSGKIPNDVGNGGRYAIIRTFTVPKDEMGMTSMGVSVSMNTVARIAIADSQLLKEGEISQIRIDTPILSEQQNISILFNNTGNIHYKAQIDALLKDRDGNVLARASVPLTNYIIPETLRVFNLSFQPEEPLMPGEYDINVSVRLEDGTILDTEVETFEV